MHQAQVAGSRIMTREEDGCADSGAGHRLRRRGAQMPLRQAGSKGALPPDLSRPRVNLGLAIRGTAPPQAHFGHIPSIGMMGNDQWGDCVYAGGGHLIEAATFYGQHRELVITTEQALSAYSAATGFDPSAGPPGGRPVQPSAARRGWSAPPTLRACAPPSRRHGKRDERPTGGASMLGGSQQNVLMRRPGQAARYCNYPRNGCRQSEIPHTSATPTARSARATSLRVRPSVNTSS